MMINNFKTDGRPWEHLNEYFQKADNRKNGDTDASSSPIFKSHTHARA